MAEWSIASVLKTDIRKRIRGSNPFLSAFYNISAGTVDYTGHKDNADHNAAVNIRNRVLEAVQKDLLKQNDNGSYSPKKPKKEKIKEILLKSTVVQDTKGTTEGIRDLRKRNFS